METTGALAAAAPLYSSALDGAFGLQDVGSAASLEGSVRQLPFAPLPLPHALPSGLSRPQQLHMLQRFFNVPASPSFHGAAGGLVLDRVLASWGTPAWWLSATARLRAQAAWDSPHTREGKPHRALLEPGLYGAAVRARAALPGGLLVRASAQLDSLHTWLPSPAGSAKQGQSTGSDAKVGGVKKAPVRARVSVLNQALLPGHDITVDAAWHATTATNAGASAPYVELPRCASASIASRHGRKGLRYRVGLVTDQRAEGAQQSTALGVWDGFGKWYAQMGATLGGSVSFYPRAREKVNTGVQRWPKPRRPEYSAMPQRARLTLGAVVGAVGRVPLVQPSREATSAARAAAQSKAAEGSSSVMAALSRAVEATSSEGVAFGGLCCGIQVGSFARPVLDYSAVSVRLDAVAGSGSLAGALTPAPLPGGKAAVATRPLTCVLTASAAQQLIGPLRLRADVRMPAHAAAGALRSLMVPEGREGAQSAAVQGVEVTYGLDVSLPAVLGAARVVGWYNPATQEALAELRFLES